MEVLDVSRRGPRYDERMEAFSHHGGTVRCGYDPNDEDTASRTADPFVRFAEAYALQMDHFVDVVRNDAQMEVQREDSAMNSTIAGMLEESALSRKFVTM